MALIRGSIDFDQILSTARKGLGSLFQMFGGGSTTTGNLASYDSNGNVIDSGVASSSVPTAGAQSYNSRTISAAGTGNQNILTNDYEVLLNHTNANPSNPTAKLPLNPANGFTVILTNVSTVGLGHSGDWIVSPTSTNVLSSAGPIGLSGGNITLSRVSGGGNVATVTLTFQSGTWVQSSGGLTPSGSAVPLLAANNLSDVASATTSRTNLGAAASGANTDITSLTPASNLSIGSPVLGSMGGWQTWTPTISAVGAMTLTGSSTSDAHYLRIGPIVFFNILISTTTSGTLTAGIKVTLPVAAVGAQTVLTADIGAGGVGYVASYGFIDSTSTFTVSPNNGANYAASFYGIFVQGFYRAA